MPSGTPRPAAHILSVNRHGYTADSPSDRPEAHASRRLSGCAGVYDSLSRFYSHVSKPISFDVNPFNVSRFVDPTSRVGQELDKVTALSLAPRAGIAHGRDGLGKNFFEFSRYRSATRTHELPITLKTRMEKPKIASFCSGVSICGSMGSHPEGPSRSDGISLMLSRLHRFDSLHSRF
jgi:hypothetical protein